MFGKAIWIKLRFTIDLSASEHLVRFGPGNFPVYCNAFIHWPTFAVCIRLAMYTFPILIALFIHKLWHHSSWDFFNRYWLDTVIPNAWSFVWYSPKDIGKNRDKTFSTFSISYEALLCIKTLVKPEVKMLLTWHLNRRLNVTKRKWWPWKMWNLHEHWYLLYHIQFSNFK